MKSKQCKCRTWPTSTTDGGFVFTTSKFLASVDALRVHSDRIGHEHVRQSRGGQPTDEVKLALLDTMVAIVSFAEEMKLIAPKERCKCDLCLRLNDAPGEPPSGSTL